MAYIKSTVVGFVSLFITTIAYVLVATVVFLRGHPPLPGTEVGFDLRALVASPLYWLIAMAAFGVGFYWSFRRP